MKALVIAIAVLAACGASQAEVEYAKRARYSADFELLVAGIREALGEFRIEVRPEARRVETAWRQVDTPMTRDGFSRQFLRYTVTIVGDGPFGIEVVARAARWDVGMAVPTELSGAAAPAWLPSRRDAMVLRIHEQLKRYERTTAK